MLHFMRKLPFLLVLAGFAIGYFAANHEPTVHAQAKPGTGFAAIPGTVGGQDTFGPYEVVKGWPKDISTIKGNEKWTYGAGAPPRKGAPGAEGRLK